jgi:hypothetical protein
MRENAIEPPYSILLSTLRHKSFLSQSPFHRITVVTGYLPSQTGQMGGRSARAVELLKTDVVKTHIVASRAILRKFFFTGTFLPFKGLAASFLLNRGIHRRCLGFW